MGHLLGFLPQFMWSNGSTPSVVQLYVIIISVFFLRLVHFWVGIHSWNQCYQSVIIFFVIHYCNVIVKLKCARPIFRSLYFISVNSVGNSFLFFFIVPITLNLSSFKSFSPCGIFENQLSIVTFRLLFLICYKKESSHLISRYSPFLQILYCIHHIFRTIISDAIRTFIP